MTTYVLVSGAWHAGWCWERVAPLLMTEGHKVLAPDLAGMGTDSTPLASITLALWADQIAGLIQREDEPVVLVGHSRGGIIISEVAERVPDCVAMLVYLAAFLVMPGETMMAAATKLSGEHSNDHVLTRPDYTSIVRPEAVQFIFYNMTPAAWVERAISLLSPEPMLPMLTPLRLTSEKYGRVPRAYIECSEDNALKLHLQRQMHADLPCGVIRTLATDHAPFYSAPDELAVSLMSIASTIRS